MRIVVGVVRHHPEAERSVEALQGIEIASRSITVLSPSASGRALSNVPTAESEQPGIGATLGSVVGGAAGTAGGLAATAVMLPGAGAVIATGAITLGVVGALAGSAAGVAVMRRATLHAGSSDRRVAWARSTLATPCRADDSLAAAARRVVAVFARSGLIQRRRAFPQRYLGHHEAQHRRREEPQPG